MIDSCHVRHPIQPCSHRTPRNACCRMSGSSSASRPSPCPEPAPSRPIKFSQSCFPVPTGSRSRRVRDSTGTVHDRIAHPGSCHCRCHEMHAWSRRSQSHGQSQSHTETRRSHASAAGGGPFSQLWRFPHPDEGHRVLFHALDSGRRVSNFSKAGSRTRTDALPRFRRYITGRRARTRGRPPFAPSFCACDSHLRTSASWHSFSGKVVIHSKRGS